MAAYGVVNLLVGWLALQLALGDHSGKASSSGALHELAQQPLGALLVWAVAVGMLLLVAWRVVEVVVDHEWGSALKAVIYAAIGISAVKVAVGDRSKGGTDSWTATLMGAPAGQLLVGAVGLGILGYGGFQVRKGWTEKFREDLEAEATTGDLGYVWLGKVGYIAKGVAIGIVGGLFVWAALEHSAKKSGGLDVALQTVLEAPAGPVLLGVIALGIVCYGVFSLARAKHLST
jgi:predicted membrane protein